MKYTKKPVTIEAIKWDGANKDQIQAFVGEPAVFAYSEMRCQTDLFINTLEGQHRAQVGDMIIKGVQGEFYPCKPDIFEQTYSEGSGDVCGVISDVQKERDRQDAKWGGAAHDDEHETWYFVQLIQDYAGWARVMSGMGSLEKVRNRLIQVAALAVAAVESIDRKSK